MSPGYLRSQRRSSILFGSTGLALLVYVRYLPTNIGDPNDEFHLQFIQPCRRKIRKRPRRHRVRRKKKQIQQPTPTQTKYKRTMHADPTPEKVSARMRNAQANSNSHLGLIRPLFNIA